MIQNVSLVVLSSMRDVDPPSGPGFVLWQVQRHTGRSVLGIPHLLAVGQNDLVVKASMIFPKPESSRVWLEEITRRVCIYTINLGVHDRQWYLRV